MKTNQLYSKKEEGYFSYIRSDILNLIPKNKTNKIFELGCGTGATLVKTKELGISKYIAGMDIVDLGQEKKIDKFILGDIESIDKLPFEDNYFDIIICADVLEHLVDPWRTINKISRILKPNGLIISSVPNIRNFKTLYDIVIKGDFKYESSGVLDKTHLRFFCKKNIKDMFINNNFSIEKITFILSKKRKFFNFLTLGLFKNFWIIQYLVVAKKGKIDDK